MTPHRRIPMRAIKTLVIGSLASSALVVAVVSPGAAFAAQPTFERITIDDTFVDEGLSEACGVTVTGSAHGRMIIRTFPGDRTGAVRILTLNVDVTLTAGNNAYSFRDVGGDLLRIEPDGTMIFSIFGQVPFQFTGVLKVDPETNEVILEPHHTTSDRLDEVCAALTG